LIEDIQHAADHPHVGAKAGFIRRISPPGMIEVDVKAEHQGNLEIHAASG